MGFSIPIVRRRGIILRMGHGKDCSFPGPRIGTWGTRRMVVPGKGGARSGFQRTLHSCPDLECGDEVAKGGGGQPGSNPLMKTNWQVLESEFRVAVQPPQGTFRPPQSDLWE